VAAPGTSIFVQGTRAESCFLLISGEVEVSKTQGADTYEMGRLEAGAIMGFPALWEESLRPVSVIATKDCTTLELTQDTFKTLIKTCPVVADALLYEAITVAAGRVSRSNTNRKGTSSQALDADKQREMLVRQAAAIREWSIPSTGPQSS
jgi:CRP-like cAMP-binding protein